MVNIESVLLILQREFRKALKLSQRHIDSAFRRFTFNLYQLQVIIARPGLKDLALTDHCYQ